MTGTTERANASHMADATVVRGAAMQEIADAHGRFEFECVGPDGEIKWRDFVENTVMTEGKNLALDTFLAGSAYTVTGPFMGLISAVSFTSIAATDVGTQINGTNSWKEAGGTNAPAYTGTRKTAAWSGASAGAKALSAALSFVMSSGSNVVIKGCFLVFGTGAVNTKDDAHGTLWSAGLFSGGDRTVSSGDTVNVSYSTSL